MKDTKKCQKFIICQNISRVLIKKKYFDISMTRMMVAFIRAPICISVVMKMWAEVWTLLHDYLMSAMLWIRVIKIAFIILANIPE